MNARGRRSVLIAGLGGLAALVVAAALRLAPSGEGRSAYADLAVSAALPERRAQDVVAAVNFDFRALDTLGEEFILFTAVAGVATVLRAPGRRDPEEDGEGEGDARERDRSADRAPPATGAAVRVLGAGLAGTTVCFGLYLATHGQVSPGGGFQGGVVLATAPLAVYLSAEAALFRRIAPLPLVDLGEGGGAVAFAGIGLLGLLAGQAFLANVLPLGTPGDALSSGTILASNVAVALEVGTGFVALLSAFVAEALDRRIRRSQR